MNLYFVFNFPDDCPFLHMLLASYFTSLGLRNILLISLVIMSRESSI